MKISIPTSQKTMPLGYGNPLWTQPNPLLTKGVWRIANGSNIPITHPTWFKTRPDAVPHILHQVHLVSDLIQQETSTWKLDTINQIYDRETSDLILSTPLPKEPNPCNQDRIIWPFSANGEFQVKKAYEIIHQSQNTNYDPPDDGVHNHKLWNLLWKIKLPHKVLLFTWKILNKAIPVKDEINRRGIPCETTCCLCNCEDESIDHLFLQWNFTRAVWFGIDINTRNLMMQQITVTQWIQDLFLNSAPQFSFLETLPRVMTTLWCIWFRRNQVIFEGKHPNPLETMLMAKSLMYRFREATIVALEPSRDHQIKDHQSKHSIQHYFHKNWDLLVITAGKSSKKSKWQGIALLGKTR